MDTRKNITGTPLISALIVFSAVFSTASGEGKQVNARDLFVYHCTACHGYDGKGTKRGRALDAPDLSDPQWQAMKTDEEILDSIIHGKNKMPRWSDKLKPEEIRALARYVRLLAPKIQP
ncbi:MAG: cytochrome c [wastewater metagenome]|nr:cytochrome c [Candidatus Loosdrechtia aerotolerans]